VSLLELHGIGKEFGAIRALHDVSFSIAPGEVVGLMGDNGAGKSTLVKIMSGIYQPSSGSLNLRRAKPRSPSARRAKRAAWASRRSTRTWRSPTISPPPRTSFSAASSRCNVGPFRFLRHRAMNRRAAELFAELKSETRADDLVRLMSGGQRQAVAIARTRPRRCAS
jgi:simple sugar transport system ATP-binding protein